MSIEQDPVLVTVNEGNGSEGFGFYVWETEAADEGYIWFGTTRPTADDLRAICPAYVEDGAA